jgi:uncharacterized protein (TIGR03437 family)
MAVDSAGNIYVAGTSFGEFPTVDAIEPSPTQLLDSVLGEASTPFVAKIDPSGSKLLYATPIGAPQAGEKLVPVGLTIDANGDAYVTGAAPSGAFPTLDGLTPPLPADPSNAPAHVFFIKLDPTGKLLLSTRFGGSTADAGSSIALDSSGAIWIAGTTQSADFPITTGPALAGGSGILLAKLDPASGKVMYARLLGQGTRPQLAAGSSGDLLIAASTTSPSWTTTAGAVQPRCAGSDCADVIAIRFRPSTEQMVYATYLGGRGVDTLDGIAADSAGSLYLTGTTASYDFPTTAAVFRSDHDCSVTGSVTCGTKAFVAHLNPDGTQLEYSTYLGGSAADQGHAIAIDAAGNAYVAGETKSIDFPILSAFQVIQIPTVCNVFYPYGNYCEAAGFLTVLNPQGSALIWSTYLGADRVGVPMDAQAFNGAESDAVDAHGNAYAAGNDLGLNAPDINPPPIPTEVFPPVDASVVKIAPTGQPLTITGVTNAASFAPGLPAPGGLALLFLSGLTGPAGIVTASGASLPATLGGFTVKVGGTPASLLAVATFDGGMGQINLQVPFVSASPSVIEVDYNGRSTFLGAKLVAPGIFTLPDGSPAVEHASDYSVVSPDNGIHLGETVVIYLTGLGVYANGTQMGVPVPGPISANPSHMPTVTLGAAGCTVLYAGPVPGYIGLDQINCRTRSDGNGSALPLVPLQVSKPDHLDLYPSDPNAFDSNVVLVAVDSSSSGTTRSNGATR